MKREGVQKTEMNDGDSFVLRLASNKLTGNLTRRIQARLVKCCKTRKLSTSSDRISGNRIAFLRSLTHCHSVMHDFDL